MIIKNVEGRWQTVRTDSESIEGLFGAIDKMSVEERKLLRMVFSQLCKNDTTVIKTLQNLEYEEPPASPEKFLTDPYYFGEVGKGLYGWVKDDIARLFNQGFEEVVLTGAQRTGKDTFAHIAVSYLLHLLLCLKDPAVSYGLAKGSMIHTILMSATQEMAKEIVFGGLIEKIKQSPWFSKFGKSMKVLSEEIRFPKGLVVKGAESTDLGVIGLSTCAVIIDEANIGRKIKAIHERNQLTDRTEAIYQAVKRRIRTTFMKQGRPPTLLMTIGSRRYPSDFVERRIRELQNDKSALCRDMSLWAARGLENFSPKLFKVLVGNDTIQSRVLPEGEQPPQGMQVISVPYDFYKDFVDDCDGSLRDIGGISVRTLSPYFSNQKSLQEMFDEGRSHPCRTVEWRIDEHLDVQWEKITHVVGGRMQPILFPDKARCVAIDLGRTKNPTGFCFKAGTKVLMANLQEKNIEDVVIGDRVIDAYGKITHVTNIFKRQYSGEIKEITVLGGSKLHATPEHPILAIKSSDIRVKNGGHPLLIKPDKYKNDRYTKYQSKVKINPEFAKASELVDGDFLAIPKIDFSQVPDWERSLFCFDEDMGTIMGYYLAEGNLFSNSGGHPQNKLDINFTFGANEFDAACKEKLAEALHRKTPMTVSFVDKPNNGKPSGSVVRVRDKRLGAFLREHCGEYSDKKFISAQALWYGTEKFHMALLRAYLNGDGTVNSIMRRHKYGVSKTKHLAAKSASEKLAKAIALLLRSYGFQAGCIYEPFVYAKRKGGIVTFGKTSRWKPIWKVVVNGANQINRLLGTVLESSQKTGLQGFQYQNWGFYPIRSIKSEEFSGYVYNIETAESHTYVANSISVHNCVGFVKGFKTVERKQPDGRIYHENLPYIVVEFTLRISPVAGEEVKFWQVRELLFKFIEHGIPIKYAVMDHWQCLTGDTRIILLNGKEIPIRDLESLYPNKTPFWVYSYDTKNGKVVPGKANAVGKTGEKVPIVEVELDNGEKIRCTKNHPFLLSDGTYKNAEDLKEDDSLMAIYRRIDAQKVVSVRDAGFEDVYDISVDIYHNFAVVSGQERLLEKQGLNSGVFVHNSDDFAQLLTEQGIETTKIKTDINAYETLKNAVYEGRIRTYPYKPLLDELSMLEYDAKKMKVDTAVEDFGNIHHDVADSVCLLVNRLSKGFRAQDFSPVSPETDYVKPQGENGPYQTVGIGETPFELLPGEKSAMQDNAQPEPTQAFPSYGLVVNGKETGWGDEVNPKTPQGYVPVSKQPMIRLEVLAQEFCTRIGIDKLPTVTVDSIKAFLFEKQLTDHRYVNAIKSHIERVYVDKLGGKTI